MILPLICPGVAYPLRFLQRVGHFISPLLIYPLLQCHSHRVACAPSTLRIADRVYVLEHGRTVRGGRSSELAGDEYIRQVYLGV